MSWLLVSRRESGPALSQCTATLCPWHCHSAELEWWLRSRGVGAGGSDVSQNWCAWLWRSRGLGQNSIPAGRSLLLSRGEGAPSALQVALVMQCSHHTSSAVPAVPQLTLPRAGRCDFALSLCFHLQKPKVLVTHGREHRAIFLLGQRTGLHQTLLSELAWGVSSGYRKQRAILHLNTPNKQTPPFCGVL